MKRLIGTAAVAALTLMSHTPIAAAEIGNGPAEVNLVTAATANCP